MFKERASRKNATVKHPTLAVLFLLALGGLFAASFPLACGGQEPSDSGDGRLDGADGGLDSGEGGLDKDAVTSDGLVGDTNPQGDGEMPEPSCSVDHGGCDILVDCTDGEDGPQCGDCPSPYEDDGHGACQCTATGAWPRQPRSFPTEGNIALGKSYSLDPDPNYSSCTDSGDLSQLTDGEARTSGYFWTEESTVGWVRKTPVITVDLGSDQPIQGISYNTAAGVAGVAWPLAIGVYVAGPDRQFHRVGNLASMHELYELPPQDGYGIQKFWTHDLHTHGRYVALAIVGAPYVFVDEIEVFAGDDAWLSEPLPGPAVDDLSEDVRKSLTRAGLVRRYLYDMHHILEKAEDMQVSQDVVERILCEWDSAWQIVQEMDPSDDFKAILPFNAVHQRILSMHAMLWKLQDQQDVTVWQSNRWDLLPYLGDPAVEQTPALSVHVMQGEYRAVQVNVTNATPRLKSISVKVEGLPSAVADGLTVHEALWTDTSQGDAVSDALPDALPDADASADGWVVSAPSGLTRQIWLRFHVTTAAPGSHQGTIALSDGKNTWTIPITVDVSSLEFPSEPHLHLGGLSYTNRVPNYAVTEENRDILVAHLEEYFADRPWATKSALPNGQYDSSGHMTTAPDTSEFDSWFDQWAGADAYGVFLAASDSFAGFPMDSAAFHHAVGAWAAFWGSHLESLGARADQLLLHVVDEPHSASQDETILAWAQAIHDAGSGVRVWEDPTYEDMQDADPSMIAECDVLCPNRQIFLAQGASYAEFFANRLAQGTTLELYSCRGPMRLLDPYSYVRMQAWTAWQMRATAMYFWSFVDSGYASAWNEYRLTKRESFIPSFIDDTTVTTSKHMEAMREGIEDYELLFMLRDAIEKAEQHGVDASLIQQARDLLGSMPDQVLPAADASTSWKADLDRSGADAAEGEVLDMIELLTL